MTHAKFETNRAESVKVVRSTNINGTEHPADQPTARPTDQPPDTVTPIYPLPNFVCGGIIIKPLLGTLCPIKNVSKYYR